MPKRPATEAQVVAALQRRYKEPAFAFIEQMPNATGWRKARTADAMAMSLWPSRGLHITGFEIKVNRGDFLLELKTPEKAEDGIYPYCHFWIVVTVPGVVADPSEVPTPWGWFEVKGGKVWTRKKPPELEPQEIDLPFLAAILRRVSEGTVARSTVDQVVAREVDESREQWQQIAVRDDQRSKRHLENLKERIKEFEDAAGFTEAGLSLDSWNHRPKKIGEVVKRVLEGDLDEATLLRHRDRHQHIADAITKLLEPRRGELFAE